MTLTIPIAPPSPSPVETLSPSPTTTTTTVPGDEHLPVTGSNDGVVVGSIAIIVLLAGVILMALVSKSRRRFEA